MVVVSEISVSIFLASKSSAEASHHSNKERQNHFSRIHCGNTLQAARDQSVGRTYQPNRAKAQMQNNFA